MLLADYICQTIEPDRIIQIGLSESALNAFFKEILLGLILDVHEFLSRRCEGPYENLYNIVEANWLATATTLSNIIKQSKTTQNLEREIAHYINCRVELRNIHKTTSTRKILNMNNELLFPPVMTVTAIAEKWSKESGTPFIDIIGLIGRGAYSGGHDTPKWKDNDYASGKILQIWPSCLVDEHGNLPISFRNRNHFTKEYKLALQTLSSPLDSEPEFARRALSEMCIRRIDFFNWCTFLNIQKPRFWFTPEPDTDTDASNAAKCLNSKNLETKDKSYKTAIDAIIKNIGIAIKGGKEWHQVTEIEQWLDQNKDKRLSKDTLTRRVNDGLRKKGIEPSQKRRKLNKN